MRLSLTRTFALASALGCAALSTGAQHEPLFRVFATESAGLDAVAEVDGRYLFPSARMEARGWRDIYLVQIPFHISPQNHAHFGEVLHHEKNRFVVIRAPETNIAALSARLHAAGLPCGAIQRLYGDRLAAGFADPTGPEPVLPVGAPHPTVAQIVGRVNPERIKQTIEAMSAMPTRYHRSASGVQVAPWLVKQYGAIARSVARNDVRIEVLAHEGITPQGSLRVIIPGSGPRAQERVILGSHIDSINLGGGQESRSPGADDNASGTATNLEIFRVMMEAGVRPSRTVEIHGYAAEEMGLWGSQDIAKKYKAANTPVVAMLQFDMDIYKANQGPDKIWLVSTSTHAGYNDMLGKLIDLYVKVPWGTRPLFGGTSDHASWTRQGYVAAFPFEDPQAYNRNIHSADDTLANAPGINQAGAFARLGAASTLHLAGLNSGFHRAVRR